MGQNRIFFFFSLFWSGMEKKTMSQAIHDKGCEVILFHVIGTILAGGGRSDSWKQRLLSSREKTGGCSLLFSYINWDLGEIQLAGTRFKGNPKRCLPHGASLRRAPRCRGSGCSHFLQEV